MDASRLPPSSAPGIRAARPPRPAIPVDRPQAVWDEIEVAAPGHGVPTRVVLLTGAECTFTCAMCDLWRHTLTGPTPPGALPAQLAAALAAPGAATAPWIKLYNASNFFAPRSVPPEDLPALAALVAGHERVIVENHPRLCDDRVPAFRDRLRGRLEVALGLETVHPAILAWLGKEMTTADAAAACRRLRSWDIDIRSFVLLGLPGLDAAEALHWATEAVRFAAGHGVRHCTLIPTRSGNGWIDRLAADGLFVPPSLGLLEAAGSAALRVAGAMLVTVDTWDLETLPGQCAACGAARRQRLVTMNLSQRLEPHPPPVCACPVETPA
jgi:uncharacterized Fe-S cluster-containing MiaB family protein